MRPRWLRQWVVCVGQWVWHSCRTPCLTPGSGEALGASPTSLTTTSTSTLARTSAVLYESCTTSPYIHFSLSTVTSLMFFLCNISVHCSVFNTTLVWNCFFCPQQYLSALCILHFLCHRLIPDYVSIFSHIVTLFCDFHVLFFVLPSNTWATKFAWPILVWMSW